MGRRGQYSGWGMLPGCADAAAGWDGLDEDTGNKPRVKWGIRLATISVVHYLLTYLPQ